MRKGRRKIERKMEGDKNRRNKEVKKDDEQRKTVRDREEDRASQQSACFSWLPAAALRL
jgi:hypothetical protein